MSILPSRLYSSAPEKKNSYKSQATDVHCHSGSIFLKTLPPVLHINESGVIYSPPRGFGAVSSHHIEAPGAFYLVNATDAGRIWVILLNVSDPHRSTSRALVLMTQFEDL